MDYAEQNQTIMSAARYDEPTMVTKQNNFALT